MSVRPISSRIALAASETGGTIGIVENVVRPGWPGPPLHHHAFHHTLANLSDGWARYLLVCTPGGFEQKFGPDAENTPPGPNTDVIVCRAPDRGDGRCAGSEWR